MGKGQEMGTSAGPVDFACVLQTQFSSFLMIL